VRANTTGAPLIQYILVRAIKFTYLTVQMFVVIRHVSLFTNKHGWGSCC